MAASVLDIRDDIPVSAFFSVTWGVFLMGIYKAGLTTMILDGV
jgi:hypothetical protein